MLVYSSSAIQEQDLGLVIELRSCIHHLIKSYKKMPNKTNLGIGAIIILLIAAYLGLDLQQSQPLVPSASDATTETLHSEPNLVPSQT